jgi:predicted transcriptional regulator
MPRRKTTGLTDAELRLMEVLWKIGQGTVAEVAAALPGEIPLAYSSVLTTLRILESKGYLRHRKDSRAYIYEPVVGRDQASENAVTHLVRRFFENSPELLVLKLIEGRKIGPRQLQRLRKRIEEAEK